MPPIRTADNETEESLQRSRKPVPSRNDALDVPNKRPKRINRGQGGAIAQLQTISEQIHEKGRPKKPGCKDILLDIPVNTMAPSGNKTDNNKIIAARPDPLLHCAAPAPTRVDAEPGSIFGFSSNLNEDPNSEMSNAVASRSREEARDSESIFMNADDEDIYCERQQDVGMEQASEVEEPEKEIDENSPDEDERQAIRNLWAPKQNEDMEQALEVEEPEKVIDEDSPDEDERQAIQILRAPKRRISHAVMSDEEEVDNESHSVLELHHQKNRTIRPPNPQSLRPATRPQSNNEATPRVAAPPFHSAGNGSARAQSVYQQQSATSTARRVISNATQKSSSHARPSSGAPHGNSGSQAHGNIRSSNATSANLRVVAADNAQVNDTHNTPTTDADDREDHDDASDASNTNVGVVKRRLNLNNAPDPTQLRFYSGSWADILKDAKNHYRLFIHADDPFPERNRNTLVDAHNCLVEAIGKFQEEVGHPIDEDVYRAHSSDMDILVFEDGATYRGRLKSLGRQIVKIFYSGILNVDVDVNLNADQHRSLVAQQVTRLIDESTFLLAKDKDEQGRSTNFGHPAILELAVCFYYTGKRDCLSSLFPKQFKSLPMPCLAMVCTCIVNCLEEWQSGVHIKIPFSGDRYETVYQDMAALIFATSEDPYHGRKLRKLASFIASDGRKRAPRNRGNPGSQGFRVRLD